MKLKKRQLFNRRSEFWFMLELQLTRSAVAYLEPVCNFSVSSIQKVDRHFMSYFQLLCCHSCVFAQSRFCSEAKLSWIVIGFSGYIVDSASMSVCHGSVFSHAKVSLGHSGTTDIPHCRGLVYICDDNWKKNKNGYQHCVVPVMNGLNGIINYTSFTNYLGDTR